MTSTSRPSDAPYTAAASPAGPAPTTIEIAHVRLVDGIIETEALRDLRDSPDSVTPSRPRQMRTGTSAALM